MTCEIYKNNYNKFIVIPRRIKFTDTLHPLSVIPNQRTGKVDILYKKRSRQLKDWGMYLVITENHFHNHPTYYFNFYLKYDIVFQGIDYVGFENIEDDFIEYLLREQICRIKVNKNNSNSMFYYEVFRKVVWELFEKSSDNFKCKNLTRILKRKSELDLAYTF